LKLWKTVLQGYEMFLYPMLDENGDIITSENLKAE
jgi:hypothetical protein